MPCHSLACIKPTSPYSHWPSHVSVCTCMRCLMPGTGPQRIQFLGDLRKHTVIHKSLTFSPQLESFMKTGFLTVVP